MDIYQIIKIRNRMCSVRENKVFEMIALITVLLVFIHFVTHNCWR